MSHHTHCRICHSLLPEPFLDLGSMPLANAFLSSQEEFSQEKTYPLAVTNCLECGLVQLTYVVSPEELYRDYIYVSSTSESVRAYAKSLAIRLVRELKLETSHFVVEVGSNDGTVLKPFQRQGLKVLGIEPARNIARIANADHVPTLDEFFSAGVAGQIVKEHGQAHVILARHVFAHFDDPHDFFQGVKSLLVPGGALFIEVPYLGDFIEGLEFDTIYHEHLSYLALEPLVRLCDLHRLSLVDVTRVPLHGGSILLEIRNTQGQNGMTDRLKQMMREEKEKGFLSPKRLERFAKDVFRWKETFEELMSRLAKDGIPLLGYGAAAKANTLLNFCPRASAHVKYILDKSPHKQGRYAPGTHLQVVPAERWKEEEKSAHILILAWNLQEEIRRQLRPFAERGGRFVIPIPKPEVV